MSARLVIWSAIAFAISLAAPARAVTVAQNDPPADPGAFALATFDIGVPGPDYTIGYDIRLSIPSELLLLQAATSGVSQITAGFGTTGTSDPVPGVPPTLLPGSIVAGNNSVQFNAGTVSDDIYLAVALVSFPIDTLQLALFATQPGTFEVGYAGFSQGFYTSFGQIDTLTFDGSFDIVVRDPDAPEVIPLPAGIWLSASALGLLGAWRARRRA